MRLRARRRRSAPSARRCGERARERSPGHTTGCPRRAARRGCWRRSPRRRCPPRRSRTPRRDARRRPPSRRAHRRARPRSGRRRRRRRSRTRPRPRRRGSRRLPRPRAASTTAARLRSEATSTVSHRPAAASKRSRAVGRRQDELRRPVRLAGELARRVAEVEALDADVAALAGERNPRAGKCPRVVDLADADDLLVAARERLADRRGRPQDVDDDRRPGPGPARPG